MTEEQIAKIKENSATVGAVLKLKDGTNIYCETQEQVEKVIKTRKFSEASYVEHAIKEQTNMVILTPGEVIKLTAYSIRESGIMSTYPISAKEKKEYNKHNEEQDKLKQLDCNYIKKKWYAPGDEPIERTQEEINERSRVFINQMISERPKDFDLMKEVDSFDPIENFKKDMELLTEKYKNKDEKTND